MNTKLMKRIADRSQLRKRLGIEFVDGQWPYLDVATWAGVARIVGEAKHEEYPSRVFVRGQVENYGEMLPSLFRHPKYDFELLQSAEAEFSRRVAEHLGVARFKVGNLGALLQHYGFRTTWLDVLDNLFVAYWFAAHKVDSSTGGMIKVSRSSNPAGWFFLISPPSKDSITVDIRTEHHPLSTRPHVQHGLSMSVGKSIDLRDCVVATIRTPTYGCIYGDLFTERGMFPPSSIDNTLKLLLKREVNLIAAKTEDSHSIMPGTLGRVTYCTGSNAMTPRLGVRRWRCN